MAVPYTILGKEIAAQRVPHTTQIVTSEVMGYGSSHRISPLRNLRMLAKVFLFGYFRLHDIVWYINEKQLN